MIYIDYNATTPRDRAVVEAMRPFIDTESGPGEGVEDYHYLLDG